MRDDIGAKVRIFVFWALKFHLKIWCIGRDESDFSDGRN
jgi:hypothetical protein